MPVLPSHKPDVVKYFLPSTAGLPEEERAWVKLDVSPALTGDLLLYTDADNMDARFMKWLVNRITEWNYQEADGSTVPVNLATIQRLPKLDYHFLYEQHLNAINNQASPQLTDTEKKSSSSTLVG